MWAIPEAAGPRAAECRSTAFTVNRVARRGVDNYDAPVSPSCVEGAAAASCNRLRIINFTDIV